MVAYLRNLVCIQSGPSKGWGLIFWHPTLLASQKMLLQEIFQLLLHMQASEILKNPNITLLTVQIVKI